jgi:thymidylate synthase (FAD)
MNMRLCSRAYWEIRALSLEIKYALENYSEEWAVISAHLFRPKCEMVGFCTETKCCGRAPQKQMEFKYEKVDKS